MTKAELVEAASKVITSPQILVAPKYVFGLDRSFTQDTTSERNNEVNHLPRTSSWANLPAAHAPAGRRRRPCHGKSINIKLISYYIIFRLNNLLNYLHIFINR